MRWRLLAVVALALASAAGGCARVGGEVTLVSRQPPRTLTQKFNQAYIAQSPSGEVQIVLLDSAADWEYNPPNTGGPLHPTPLSPLRQVIHIQLHWRPIVGTTRSPAAVNASIDWYVLGSDGSDDVLVYEGAAYVTAESSGRLRDISIRQGQLALRASRGKLHDPVGPADISGNFVARANEAKVRDTLAEIEEHVGSAPQAAR